MIPPGFIHDLLARVDIVEVVGRHVELKKAGINHKGLCPFHGEKSPSFTVSPSRQTYHCFGCGVHGNAIGFLMEHTGAGFVEAVEDLAQQVGMQVPQDERTAEQRERAQAERARHVSLTDVLARAADHYRAQLKKSPRAIDYLKGRGLTGQIAARFALGYAPEGWRSLASGFPSYDDPQLVESGLVIDKSAEDETEGTQEGRPGGRRYDRFRDRVMFPIRNVQGEVIGFGGRVLDKGEPKYLNSPETPVFHKGRELYGLFEARTALRQRGYALVVEGYMDVVALAQHGLGNAVATLGTACTPDHVHKLFRFTEDVVFSFDGDAAGRRAAVRALEASLPHVNESRSVKFLFLPTEHDPDSYVREFGTEAFERCVEAAVPLSRQLVAVAGDGCDLATPEGRARMLKQARPLWELLPEGLLRRQLLGELARQGQLPEAELQGLWAGTSASAARAATSSEPSQGGNERYQGEGRDASSERRHQGEWNSGKSDWKSGERKSGEWKSGSRKSGDWKSGKWRNREADARPSGPRAAPATAADNAVRLLLQHSELWESLSEEDKGLLHDLQGMHGELIRWLERHLTHHGASPWAAVQAGLTADGLADAAHRLSRPHQELGIQESDPGGDLHRAVTELRSRRPAVLPGGATASDDDRRLALEALARLRERHGLGTD